MAACSGPAAGPCPRDGWPSARPSPWPWPSPSPRCWCWCWAVNALAAALALLGLCSYVLLYTALLKPRTTQNIVIGGIAGAIPPLVGAAAATGQLGWSSWWLFALVMVWTPAHFWALALLLHDDYRSVGIPMLPVVKGVEATARAIGRYSRLTVALSLAGVIALPSGGWLYGLLVLPFNARLLQLSASLAEAPGRSPPRPQPVPLVDLLPLRHLPAAGAGAHAPRRLGGSHRPAHGGRASGTGCLCLDWLQFPAPRD